ncbi:hypothetical protein QZH41_014995 [Actinostola sp. cb2023]|nr:hypothetical protein QZH41_014995 [Actinostola sp. cb2023]
MAEIEGRTGKIPDDELPLYEEAFKALDLDNSGFIENDEIVNLLESLELKVPGHKLRTLKDDYGDQIDFEEFQEVSFIVS